MNLSEEQIRMIADAIDIMNIKKYIEEHLEDYEKFLKEKSINESKQVDGIKI
jgi:hypothetical protein